MAWIACVARASALELCLAIAAACCAASVAASDAKFGADITAALPSERAWATGIASIRVSALVPASKTLRDNVERSIDRSMFGARTSRERLRRADRRRDMGFPDEIRCGYALSVGYRVGMEALARGAIAASGPKSDSDGRLRRARGRSRATFGFRDTATDAWSDMTWPGKLRCW